MSLKILVVDDDADVLKVTKNVIQSLGYEVLGIVDSREAAERINRQKFDGIFVDYRMPHLDGTELVHRIRNSATNNSVPIVMLTGHDDVETMRAGFRAGITFFMGKPPEVKQIANVLRLMQDVMLREKRSYARLPLRTVVTCHAKRRQFTSVSLNISEGGMLLETSGGLEPGDEVEVCFSVPPSPGLLDCGGQVSRREPPDRMAIRFVDLTSEDRKAIQAYIAVRVKA